MGFDERWISLVMKCVSSVSYLMVVNGRIGERFKPKRGLHQGDPLSPFLFLICSEGLSSLMRMTLSEEKIKGAKASKGEPQISHLLFADDSILFGDATIVGAKAFKIMLKEYEICFGQCINFSKSTIFFSTNTSNVDCQNVSGVLGICCSNDPKNYLGLLNIVGRRKTTSFKS